MLLRMVAATTAASVSILVGSPAADASSAANASSAVAVQDGTVIDAVTFHGSGCAPGTAVVAPSPDDTAFTVTYSDFLAQTAVGSPADVRKDCSLSVHVRAPQGFIYALSAVDYRGFASLQDGAKAVQRAGYNFHGNSRATPISHTLRGPYEDYWQFTDTNDPSRFFYQTCGQNEPLDINMELRVNSGSSDRRKDVSFIAMDSTDGTIKTTFHLASKPCPAT